MSALREQPLLVLAGSTGTGKTAAALHWARTLMPAELVGADSVQVYRGFDIGSAKPNAEELAGVPHHLIDIVEPTEFIDAMAYARRADKAIAAVAARGKLPIVVGGTGLWLRALTRGLVELPPVDHALRARLIEEGERIGRPALHARLASVDPKAAKQIHPNDLVRITRALEVYEQTGQPLGELRERHALGARRYKSFFIVLERPTSYERDIEARVERMLEAGWRDEVRALLERYPPDARAFGSVGYRQLVEHLNEGVDMEETRAKIIKATRVYGRRQATWLASEPGIDWRTDYATLRSDEGARRVREWFDAS